MQGKHGEYSQDRCHQSGGQQLIDEPSAPALTERPSWLLKRRSSAIDGEIGLWGGSLRSHRVSTDSDLVAAAVEGDRAALSDLCELHYSAVLRFCRRLTRGPHAAEDLTQATFTRVVQKISSFDQGEPLLPWLQTLARNIYIDEWRAQARRPQEIELSEVTLAGRRSVEGSLADDVVNRVVLDDALRSMSPRYRRVIQLRELEGHSYKELATRLDATMPAVSKLVGRAADQLRQRLDRVIALGLLIRLRLRSAAVRSRANFEGLTQGAHALYGAASVGIVGMVGGVIFGLIVSSGPSVGAERPPRRGQAVSANLISSSSDPLSSSRNASRQPRNSVVSAGPVSIATWEPAGVEARADHRGGSRHGLLHRHGRGR